MRARVRWGAWGAAFGVCFPVMALGIRWAQGGQEGALAAFGSDPLLWIILSAPLFLGTFAYIGGVQQDGLRELSDALEQRVKDRTAALRDLTERMALVLDSIADAMMTIRLDGELDGPPQAQSIRWFGPHWQGKQLSAYLAPGDDKLRVGLAMGLEQVRDEILPLELTLAQMPTQCRRDGRDLALEYRPIDAPGRERVLLVAARDVTAILEMERSQAERMELHAVVAQILRDPAGFAQFRAECQSLLDQVAAAPDERTLRHRVHTLKGNSAVYGFGQISAACQALEDAWAERGKANLIGSDLEQLRDVHARSMVVVSGFVPQEDAEIVRVPRSDVMALISDVRAKVPENQIAATLRDWSLEPIAPVLERLGSHAKQLASRCGKRVSFQCNDTKVRIDLAWLAPFLQGLVHAVRNAVDHGIETPDKRRELGKEEVGRVTMTVARGQQGVVIELEDDGRGVDWEALGTKARGLGLPYQTEAERLAALFHDGLSTAAEVTEISGRGVGLSALRAACSQLGITIECRSRPGQGTTFTFRLPPPALSWRPPLGMSLAVPRSVSLRPMDRPGTGR